MLQTIVTTLLLAATPVATQAVDSSPSQLVDAFIAAQQAFDQASLARLTDPDYVEISPLGEVDMRERMLGFYAPDKKQPAPPAAISERTIRAHGDEAIVTLKLSYGQAALRAVYVLRRTPAGWRLLSAQYTPIRTRPTS